MQALTLVPELCGRQHIRFHKRKYSPDATKIEGCLEMLGVQTKRKRLKRDVSCAYRLLPLRRQTARLKDVMLSAADDQSIFVADPPFVAWPSTPYNRTPVLRLPIVALASRTITAGSVDITYLRR
ncbi:hypothetical protein AB1N83_006738 [Pleurotus pulmonarius]